MSYQYKTKVITLPVSQEQAVITQGGGRAIEIMQEAFEDEEPMRGVEEYLAHLTKELGHKGKAKADDEKDKITADDIRALYVPDQVFLGIEIYKLNYGNVCTVPYQCPKCGVDDLAYDVPVNKLPLKTLEDVGLSPGNLTWSEKLKMSGHEVTLSFMTSKQVAEVEATSLVRLVFNAIKTIDGKLPTYMQVEELPIGDQKQIHKSYVAHRVGYDTTVSFQCESKKCMKRITINLLSEPAFLFAPLPVSLT